MLRCHHHSSHFCHVISERQREHTRSGARSSWWCSDGILWGTQRQSECWVSGASILRSLSYHEEWDSNSREVVNQVPNDGIILEGRKMPKKCRGKTAWCNRECSYASTIHMHMVNNQSIIAHQPTICWECIDYLSPPIKFSSYPILRHRKRSFTRKCRRTHPRLKLESLAEEKSCACVLTSFS